MSDTGARARWIVLGAVVATFVLYRVPYGAYVVYPMMLLSTYAHEMGHGVTAVLVGGRFDRFVMYADGSGAAYTATALGIQRALVAAGGLVGPAILGAVLFMAAARPKLARAALWTFAIAVVLSLLLVVRNPFGWAFLAIVAVATGAVASRGSELAGQCTLAFIAAQMAASVFSRGDYLFTPTAQTAAGAMPSDVAQISEVLLLPYWVWGALCGLVSIAVLVGGLAVFWRATSLSDAQ
ncbi:MAG: M50 family metallopeptidase [Myxococcota bacterium]